MPHLPDGGSDVTLIDLSSMESGMKVDGSEDRIIRKLVCAPIQA